MKSRTATVETGIAHCPRCAASIHAQKSARRRRVQCPKCREIVVLGGITPIVKTAPAQPEIAAASADEITFLTARVETLERGAAAMMETPRGAKLRWLTVEPQQRYSNAQAEALRGNLATLPAHHITIETLPGDASARERAEWFKTVFTEARWTVHGPEDAPIAHITRPGVSLATGLPVSARAAATYLAVRAAGFDIATIFDPDLGEGEPRLIVA